MGGQRLNTMVDTGLANIASEVKKVSSAQGMKSLLTSRLSETEDEATRAEIIEEMEMVYDQLEDALVEFEVPDSKLRKSLLDKAKTSIKAAVIEPLQDLYSTAVEAVAKNQLDHRLAVGKKYLAEREQKFIEKQCEETAIARRNRLQSRAPQPPQAELYADLM